MGGIISGAEKTIKNVGGATKDIFTGKGNLNDLRMMATSDLFDQIYDSTIGKKDPAAPPADPNDPFTFDPYSAAMDQKSILDLSNRQYADTDAYNAQDQELRANARQKLAEALTRQSQTSFQQGLPETEEILNSQHLLNGSGLGQELGRQQGNIATNITNQMGVIGAGDINRASDIRLQALQGKQGQQSAALSRGFSLQDFVKQAQVAKAIGATSAPQVPSGKATGLSGGLAGAGTGAYIGTGISPGYGTALGAILGGASGYAGGSNMYAKGGK